jgi:hypothetical protein
VTDRALLADILPLIAQARDDVEVAQKLIAEGNADLAAAEVLRFCGQELDDALAVCDQRET